MSLGFITYASRAGAERGVAAGHATVLIAGDDPPTAPRARQSGARQHGAPQGRSEPDCG